MNKLFQLLVIVILLIGIETRCEAIPLYDNGQSSWSGASGFGYVTIDVLADDFVLDVQSTIDSATVDLWLAKEMDPINGDIQWWLFNDNNGDPGAITDSGYGTNLSSTHVGQHPANDNVQFWTLAFNFDHGVSVKANNSYWFGLSIQDLGNVGWSNSLTKGYNDARSPNGTFDNWEHTSSSNSDMSFKLYGEPVPEPATMLLFGAGLAGLVGYRRRQAKKK